MINKRIPAECFPVGNFIEDELKARGWSHEDLAREMGNLPVSVVDEIISGEIRIDFMISLTLSHAFGDVYGIFYWLKLDMIYQQHLKNLPSEAFPDIL